MSPPVRLMPAGRRHMGRIPILLLCVLALVGLPAAAAFTLAPAPSASAPDPAPPRRPSAAEARDNAGLPGEPSAESPVVPQIKVPLGRTPAAPSSKATPASRTRHTPAHGAIDDAAARCLALESPAARRDCLDRLKRLATPR